MMTMVMICSHLPGWWYLPLSWSSLLLLSPSQVSRFCKTLVSLEKLREWFTNRNFELRRERLQVLINSWSKDYKWLEYEKGTLVDDEHESKIDIMCLIYYLFVRFSICFEVFEKKRGERESRMETFSSKASFMAEQKNKEGPIFSLSEIHIYKYINMWASIYSLDREMINK